jgi:hypothetical protein
MDRYVIRTRPAADTANVPVQRVHGAAGLTFSVAGPSSSAQYIQRLDKRTGWFRATVEPHTDPATHRSFLRAQQIRSLSQLRPLRFISMHCPQPSVPGPAKPCLAFDYDGELLAYARSDGLLSLFDELSLGAAVCRLRNVSAPLSTARLTVEDDAAIVKPVRRTDVMRPTATGCTHHHLVCRCTVYSWPAAVLGR